MFTQYVSVGNEGTWTFGVQHDHPNTAISSVFKQDLRDANDEVAKVFQLPIHNMNTRIGYFNREKIILRELDLFVLDNSLQESTVGQVRGHTVEQKWQIYNQVKKAGFKYIVLASLNGSPCTAYHFIHDLNHKGENLENAFAAVEFVDICSNSHVPKPEVPVSLQRCEQYGIPNVIMEVDLMHHVVDYGKFNAQEMCALLSNRFNWIRNHLSASSMIIVNIRDFSECMKSYPTRVFCLVNYLASLPVDERIFGISYEDAGKFYPEQLAVWTFCVREEMKRFGWYNGHLLVNIHDQYGLCNGTTLDCLADGASGIWAGLSEEGAAMGHASSCLTIMNLIRLGNQKVLQNYKCDELREASRCITRATTGQQPHHREPVVGDRALDIYFGLEPLSLCGAERIFDEHEGAELHITSESPSEKILIKLNFAFGSDKNFDENRADKMKEVMHHDAHALRKEDYNSSAGLAALYQRSGGSLTSGMRDVIQTKERRASHIGTLIDEVHETWKEWAVEGDGSQTGRDELDFFAFYKGFMSPYFATCRDNNISELLQAISLEKDGKVDWDEFLVYLKWAGNQYPDTERCEELLNIAFRKRILPAMKLEAIERVRSVLLHCEDTKSEQFYKNYERKHDLFFTTEPPCEVHEAAVMEEIVVAEVATVEESAMDEQQFLEMFDQVVTVETKDEASNQIAYEVSIKTGDIAGAGTDANVFIILYGTDRDTGKILLDYSKTANQNIFERNHEDTFTVLAADVGPVSRIRIGHNGEGSSSSWFLNTVRVDIPTQNDSLNFSANRWLSRTEDDKQIEVELSPSSCDHIDVSEDGNITYAITVKTGECYGAGTDANVYIQLFGDKKYTEVIKLDKPMFSKESFERGYRDMFKVEGVNVGTITSIKIGHDNEGGFAAWYLDWVSVQANDYDIMFKADRWLDANSGDNKFEVELFPPKTEDTVQSVVFQVSRTEELTAPKEPVKINVRTAQKRKYDIHVKTSDVRWAGTDATVHVILYGEHGVTNRLILDKSKTYKKPFERKQVDKFAMEALDVGNLTNIRIGHDGTGVGAGWHLDKVLVQIPGTKTKWNFAAKRWLDSKSGDGKIEIDIPASKK